MQTKKYPFPRYISVFWEKSDFKFNQSNNLCTPSNNLAWLFKSGGDRVPIPLKNSEIVNKGNNKRQNVKISGNVLVKLFRFFGNRSNNKQQNVKISGNTLVQLFRFFCSSYKIFTKKFLNYSVSSLINATTSNKMLKYREMFWFNYFVLFAAFINFLQRSS